MSFPDFIITGSAKCGTTALWYNLDKHPFIDMAVKNGTSVEMNFWRSRCWNKGKDWYKKQFKGKKLNGEKSISYFFNKDSMRAIKNNIPNVKLLICLRHPVDRAFSNYQMNQRAGKINQKFTYGLFTQRYAKGGKYFNQIKNKILKFFDRNQVHICVMEWMKRDPTTEMKKVFKFLGVPDLGFPAKEIGGELLKNHSRQQDIKKNRQEEFYRVWSKFTKRLNGNLRHQILNYYKPFNQDLFDFLGYRIEEWTR